MALTTPITKSPALKEFERYKERNPEYFPTGTPLEKQMGVFSVIKDIHNKRELKKLSDLQTSRYRRRM